MFRITFSFVIIFSWWSLCRGFPDPGTGPPAPTNQSGTPIPGTPELVPQFFQIIIPTAQGPRWIAVPAGHPYLAFAAMWRVQAFQQAMVMQQAAMAQAALSLQAAQAERDRQQRMRQFPWRRDPLFQHLSEGADYVCQSCQGCFYREGVRGVYDQQVIQFATTTLQSFYPQLDPHRLQLCHTCKEYFRKKKVPKLCIANNLALDAIPPELGILNDMELRLICRAQTFQTVLVLQHGQHAARGVAISYNNDVVHLLDRLPRPASSDGSGLIIVRVSQNEQADDDIRRLPAPREYRVQWPRVYAALRWLKANNELYRHIQIHGIPEDGEQEEPQAMEIDDPYANMDPRTVAQSVLLPQDPVQNTNAMAAALGNDILEEPTLSYNLERITGQPINSYATRNLEGLAHPREFPRGINFFGFPREQKINLGEYYRSRARHVDTRFQHPHYLGTAVSAWQHSQLCSAAGIAVRWRRGQRLTVGDLRQAATAPMQSMELSDRCWSYMRNIRGTAAYWQAAKNDLFGMLRQVGAPTWFMTFSANDFGWDDLAVALSGKHNMTDDQIYEYLNSLSDNERRDLLLNNQSAAARHFSHRWAEMLKWIRSEGGPGLGTITDYFWRVEFQRRGSPHIHLLLWVEGAPNLDTEEGRAAAPAYLDQHCNATIPDADLADPESVDLRKLVSTLQQHHHTHTCYKNQGEGNTNCRFKFPRPECNATRLRMYGDTLARDSDLCLQQRGFADVNTVPYNARCLQQWRANMDMQLIGSAHGAACYVASYLAKQESDGVQQCVQAALERAPECLPERNRFIRIGTAVLSQREYSMQEATYLLVGLPLRGCSRTSVRLCVGYPEHRIGIVMPESTLQRADEDELVYAPSAHDRYALRPDQLENVTLAEWMIWYEVTEKSTEGSLELKNQHGDHRKCVRRRTHAAILRTFPRMNEESHGDEYYYSLLLLYLPWRNETLVTEGYESAEAAFSARHAEISQYMPDETFGEEVEAAVERLHAAGEYAQLVAHAAAAPGGEAGSGDSDAARVDQGAAAWHPIHLNEHPLQALEQAMDGIAGDGNHVTFTEVQQAMLEIASGGAGAITETAYRAMLAAMTSDQRNAFNLVKYHVVGIRKGSVTEPLHLFVTGGAGVGKSYFINVLVEYLKRAHSGIARGKSVMLAAPTGVAAFNIAASTLHDKNCLKLDVEHARQGGNARVQYRSLRAQDLQRLRAVWANIRYLIIDEISMVSYETLVHIHRRLCEIKGNEQLFGGVSIIAVGDLFQLPPVKAKYIFQNSGSHQISLPRRCGHLWRNLFKGALLRQNQRQRGDTSWATHLNALRDLRDETAVKEAFAALRTRISVPANGINLESPEWSNVPHLYPRVDQCVAHNEAKLRQLAGNDITVIHALDAYTDPALAHQQPRPSGNKDETGGLASVLQLAIGARVMLRRNIATDDGLVNGAQGVVVGFRYAHGRPLVPNEAPVGVQVLFDNPRVGRLYRMAEHVKSLGSTGVPASAAMAAAADAREPVEICSSTAIFRESAGAASSRGRGRGRGRGGRASGYSRSSREVQRTQFPLELSWAVTIHRVQGLSLDKAVIDLGELVFEKGQAYVALSRVKTLQGVALVNLKEQSIMVDEEVVEEYCRLGLAVEVDQENMDSNLRLAAAAAVGAGAATTAMLAAGVESGSRRGREEEEEEQQEEQQRTRVLRLRIQTPTEVAEIVREIEEEEDRRLQDNWYGHDMSQWPPLGIQSSNGHPTTLSCLYMPLILDAMGLESLCQDRGHYCPGSKFRFPRPPQWLFWVSELRQGLELRRALDSQNLTEHVDGPSHLTTQFQEYLMDAVPALKRRLDLWVQGYLAGQQPADADLIPELYALLED